MTIEGPPPERMSPVILQMKLSELRKELREAREKGDDARVRAIGQDLAKLQMSTMVFQPGGPVNL